jgi:hypothetical protein
LILPVVFFFVFFATHATRAQYQPWNFTSLSFYYALWDSFVPTRCQTANPDQPWICLFGVARSSLIVFVCHKMASYALMICSYATMASPLFVIEAQTDQVVMPLHNGLPNVWDSATNPVCLNNVANCPKAVLDFMALWRSKMAGALVNQIRASDGLFHPAWYALATIFNRHSYNFAPQNSLIHTSFGWFGPMLYGKNFNTAFSDWLFHRAPKVQLIDTCGIMCNPTCNMSLSIV